MKAYRNNGAVGALLDEYERAIFELVDILVLVSQDDFRQIVDPDTEDKDCRSIQTIMTHLVGSGYTYIFYIENKYICDTPRIKIEPKETIEENIDELKVMFAYTERVFLENPNLPTESESNEDKMSVSWGGLYDIEQLMEHAIVHILRHRRQIERFLLKMN